MTNRLYYADNLDALREHVADESVDLVYLDPPFISNANYNILFKSPAGLAAESSGYARAFDLLRAMRSFLGENDMMAYLSMMANPRHRAPPRAEAHGQPLPPLRSHRFALFETDARRGVRSGQLPQRDHLEAHHGS